MKETRGMAQLGMFLSVYFPATFPFLLHSSDQNLHFVRCLLFRATAGGLRPPRILSVALTLHATTPHPIWLTHRIPTGILIMVRFGLTSVNQVSWRRVLVACLKRGYLVFFRRLSCVVSRGYLCSAHRQSICESLFEARFCGFSSSVENRLMLKSFACQASSEEW